MLWLHNVDTIICDNLLTEAESALVFAEGLPFLEALLSEATAGADTLETTISKASEQAGSKQDS